GTPPAPVRPRPRARRTRWRGNSSFPGRARARSAWKILTGALTAPVIPAVAPAHPSFLQFRTALLQSVARPSPRALRPPTVPPIDTWEARHERETPGSD